MEPSPKAPAFPPLERTLLGLAPPLEAPGMSFEATIARSSVSFGATLPAAALPVVPPAALPEVSVDLSVGEAARTVAPGARLHGVDLEVVGVLGEGGMGVVHLARQRSLDRDVALKTTRPGASEGALAALAAEAVVTGGLEHPSIVPVHAYGRSADGRPVMVMKRVEGTSWKELLRDPAHALWESIDTDERLVGHLQILSQVSNALSFAHSRGVVHRDVKPENVMIGSFGEVYLVDLGLAVRMDHPSEEPPSIVGSPAYMAPEMVGGLPVDARTDVYLLGATLHEILTGRPPHAGETLVEVLTAAYASEAPRFGDEVPEELAALCVRALARSPDERPESARAFRACIADFLEHRGSVLLARRGEERLAELAALGLDDQVLRRRRRALLAESRFAFRQALAGWSENAVAREGERAVIEASVLLEIEDGHAKAARAELEALDDPPERLVRALRELEERLAEDASEKERLRGLARDLDTSIGTEARRKAALGIAGVATMVSVYVIRHGQVATLTPEKLVPIAGFMVAMMTLLLVTFRRRLFRNAFGVRIATLAYLSSWVMLVHRLMAARAGEPVHAVLATDSLIFTAMLLVTGVTLARFLLAGALFTFAGAVWGILVPSQAPVAFSTSTIAMLLAAALLFRPERTDGGDVG